MEAYHRYFERWLKVANHLRMRDRSVKVLQYGCQMILGYYGKILQTATKEQLSLLRRASSTSRKAFWLLKWVNHIGDASKLFETKILTRTAEIVDVFDFLEQICLIVYYLYENLIFLARMKMFDLNEDKLDWPCNLSWFLGDLAFVVTSLIRFYQALKKKSLLIHSQTQRKSLITSSSTSSSPSSSSTLIDNSSLTVLDDEFDDEVKDTDHLSHQQQSNTKQQHQTNQIHQIPPKNNEKDKEQFTQDKQEENRQKQEDQLYESRLREREEEVWDSGLSFLISLLEIGVSAYYVDLYRPLLSLLPLPSSRHSHSSSYSSSSSPSSTIISSIVKGHPHPPLHSFPHSLSSSPSLPSLNSSSLSTSVCPSSPPPSFSMSFPTIFPYREGEMKGIGEGEVGLMGVLSSLFIIYQFARKT